MTYRVLHSSFWEQVLPGYVSNGCSSLQSLWVILSPLSITFMCWSRVCADNTLLNFRVEPVRFSGVPFLCDSFFSVLCLKNSTGLVSLTTQLCLLNVGILLDYTWFHSVIHDQGTFSDSKQGQAQVSSHSFLIFQGSLSFIAYYPVSWKPMLPIFCLLFICVRKKGKHSLPNFILARNRSPIMVSNPGYLHFLGRKIRA